MSIMLEGPRLSEVLDWKLEDPDDADCKSIRFHILDRIIEENGLDYGIDGVFYFDFAEARFVFVYQPENEEDELNEIVAEAGDSLRKGGTTAVDALADALLSRGFTILSSEDYSRLAEQSGAWYHQPRGAEYLEEKEED